MDYGDERRIMKFLKIGMRVWEKETNPVPGPEITQKTLVVLKMMQIIDRTVETPEDKIQTVKQLLTLNHKLGKKK